jgi:hypothetical protein
MIAGRPYRTAITHEEAIRELRRQGGVQFDPELVEVFAEVFAAGVPWEPDVHEHDHDPSLAAHAHELYVPGRGTPAHRIGTGRSGAITTAELHDGVHDRRRRAG